MQPGTAELGTGAAPCALLRLRCPHRGGAAGPRLTLDGSHHAMSAHRDTSRHIAQRSMPRSPIDRRQSP